MGLSESKEKEVPENSATEISRGDLQSNSEEAPEMPRTKLHQTKADEEDENVKQLQECSVLYLSLQECLAKTDRSWKSCQLGIVTEILISHLEVVSPYSSPLVFLDSWNWETGDFDNIGDDVKSKLIKIIGSTDNYLKIVNLLIIVRIDEVDVFHIHLLFVFDMLFHSPFQPIFY